MATMKFIHAALTASLIVLTGCTVPVHAARPAKPLRSATPAQVGLSAERLERMGEFFRSEVEKGTTAGYVLLVARHGKLVYSTAIGMRDREQQLPMTLDTRFRIMSMTKPVTSVAVLMLYEEGRLQLDDPVSGPVVRDRHAAQLRVVFGRDGDFRPRLDAAVHALQPLLAPHRR